MSRPDTSDIPEVGEEWFAAAKLRLPDSPRPCVFCGGKGWVVYLAPANPWFSHPTIQAQAVERCAVCRGSGCAPRGLRR